jgi:hypothetical protein
MKSFNHKERKVPIAIGIRKEHKEIAKKPTPPSPDYGGQSPTPSREGNFSN